jgi:hypothetical protein
VIVKMDMRDEGEGSGNGNSQRAFKPIPILESSSSKGSAEL